MTITIKRQYVHKRFGEVGHVAFETFINGKGEVAMRVNENDLPVNSVEYLLTFALQSLQDSYAGAKDADEAKGSFSKKLKKLIAGDIGTRGGGGVSSVQTKARQIARALFKAQKTKEQFAKRFGPEVPTADQNAFADNLVAQVPAILAQAQKQVAEDERRKAELAEMEISFDVDSE